MPLPHVEGGEYLLSYLFEFGPTSKDGPVTMLDVESWARALGFTWAPWQSRLLVRLSREYTGAQHEATGYFTPPPWPEVANMWNWVRNQKAEQAIDRFEERQARQDKRKANKKDRPHGNRK